MNAFAAILSLGQHVTARWSDRLSRWAVEHAIGFSTSGKALWAGQREGRGWRVTSLDIETPRGKQLCLAAGNLRLDDLPRVAGEGSGPGPTGATDDLAWALTAYAHGKEDELDRHLGGEYSLAIWDEAKEVCHLWRDPLGYSSLYYCLVDGALLVSSSLPCIARLRGQGDRIDPEQMAYFLLCGHKPFATDKSYVQGIEQVKPGWRVTVSAGGIQRTELWRFDSLGASRSGDRREYAESFLDALSFSLESRIAQDEIVWFDLSGGLDSTTLCYLGQRYFGETAPRRMRLRSITRAHYPEFAESDYIEEARRGGARQAF